MSKKQLLAAALAAAFLAAGGEAKAADTADTVVVTGANDVKVNGAATDTTAVSNIIAGGPGVGIVDGTDPQNAVSGTINIIGGTSNNVLTITGNVEADGGTVNIGGGTTANRVALTAASVVTNNAGDVITITAGSTLQTASGSIEEGSTLNVAGTYINDGSSDYLSVDGTLNNTGRIVVQNGGDITFYGTSVYTGGGTIDSSNGGNLFFYGGSGDILADMTFENLDTLGGFGYIEVEGNITKAINLSDAVDGYLFVYDDGSEQAVISADINLGEGAFWTFNVGGGGVLIQGASITAEENGLDGGTVIDATSSITGNVTIYNADPSATPSKPAVVNQGTINLVSADGQTPYDLDWGGPNDVLANKGKIFIGADSDIGTFCVGILDNTAEDALVSIDQGFFTNAPNTDSQDNLETAMTQGTTGNIGAVEITGTVTKGFTAFGTAAASKAGTVTLTDALNVADPDAIISTAVDLVLDKGGVMKGATLAAANIAIKDDITFGLTFIATPGAGTTTLAAGQSATFVDTMLLTNFTAGDGTVLNIGEAGAVGRLAVHSGFSLNADNAAIVFTANGAGGLNNLDVLDGGALNLTSNTILKNYSDEDLTGATVLNRYDSGVISIDGGATSLAEYLKAQSSLSLYADTVYEEDGNGNVFLTRSIARSADQNLGRILDAQGIAQYRGMISDATLQSQYDITRIYENEASAAYQALSASERYVVDVVKIASGETVGGYSLMNGDRPTEAYALEQWKNGADWSGSVEAVTDTVRNFNRAIANRAYNLGSLLNAVEYDECGNVIASCGGFKNRLWAGYTGQWDRNSGRAWDKGYTYDAHGFNIGYDHVTSSGVGFGAAFGYSAGDYKNRARLAGEKSDIDNYSFGLFASYNHASGLFATLSGTYTRSDYKMRNSFSDYGTGGFDRAKYHGNTWSFGGQIGYDLRPTSSLTITPTVGLYYYDSSTNRFNSTYRQGLKYSRHDLELPVDVTVKYDIEVGCDSTLSLTATGGYAYNFTNRGTRIHGFTMNESYAFGNHRGPGVGHSSWTAGGGVRYRYKNIDFGVNYEYYGRKDFTSHNLTANVGYSF